MSDTCPRCGLDLSTQEPQIGEVWLRTNNSTLYLVTSERGVGARPYAAAVRLHTPEGQQGYDPEWLCVMWSDQIRRGEWIRIRVDAAGLAQLSPNSKETK